MRGHIAMQDPARGVFHDHKDIEEPKGRRHYHTEVTGDDSCGMIADKRPPTLGRHALPWPWSTRLGMYFRTVRGDTRRPSLSNSSLAMRS